MSLLTEEQIEQLVKIASVTSTVKSYHDKFCEWNEKQQPSAQYAPDWDNAPCDATSVYLQSAWFDTHMKEIYRVTICGWGRPVTPHPHAEMMAKYAEVAARRVDPWVEFERFSHCDMEWDGLLYHPDWTHGQTYRHIGDNK